MVGNEEKIQIYKDDLKNIYKSIVNLKKPEQSVSIKEFFEWILVLFISYPILAGIIFFMILFLVIMPLDVIYNTGIATHGGLLDNEIGLTLIIWPWKYWNFVIPILFIIFLCGKFNEYTDKKEFEEKRKSLFQKGEVIENKLNKLSKKYEKEQEIKRGLLKIKEKKQAELILHEIQEIAIKSRIKIIQEIYEVAEEEFKKGYYSRLKYRLEKAVEEHKKELDIQNQKAEERTQKAKEKRKAEQILLEISELAVKPKIKEIREIYEKAQEYFESGKYRKLDRLFDNATKLRSKILFEKRQKRKRELFERKQKAKGLIKFIDNSGTEKWGTPTQVKKWKEIDIDLNNNFVNLNGYQFEEFIAKLFKKMGYKVTVTPKSRDYGIDVIAEDKEDVIAIQCKKLKAGSNISNRDIQRARGSMDFYDANKCIIVTNQDFTIQAKEQARRTKNTEIWNKHILHQMVKRYFIDD